MKNKPDPLDQLEAEGKVLCPKAGREQEFLKALREAHQIGHGALGWQGQAEMMVEIGLDKVLETAENIKFPKNKKAKIAKMKKILIQSLMNSIFDNGEWVTPEEANSRNTYNKVLYDESLDDTPNTK